MEEKEQTTHTIEVTKSNNKKLKRTQSVIITDFDMPFSSMVSFMIKWALASIPSIVLLFIIGIIMSLIFISIFGSIMLTSFSQF
jgi:hypothetical protein